jgi:hypothetical protein
VQADASFIRQRDAADDEVEFALAQLVQERAVEDTQNVCTSSAAAGIGNVAGRGADLARLSRSSSPALRMLPVVKCVARPIFIGR